VGAAPDLAVQRLGFLPVADETIPLIKPSKPRRFRTFLMILAGLAVVLFSSLRAIATFWTDFLWFDSVNFRSVWTGVLGTKAGLFGVFALAAFVLTWVNLFVADRLRPPDMLFNDSTDEMVQRFRAMSRRRAFLARTASAALVALFSAVGVSGQWQNWILFRNGGSFGTEDAQFGRDVGFYIFQLPFLTFAASWIFLTLLTVTLAVAAVHYFNGGIRSAAAAGNGARISRQVKMHVSLLLGLVALARALQYWLQRFELLYSTRGEIAGGANYTDIQYQLPAYDLLIVISIVAFVLLVANVVRRGWTLPAVAVSLWVVVSIVLGNVFPAAIQALRVNSGGITYEEPYVKRNIEATRKAFGFDDSTTGTSRVTTVEYAKPSAGAIDADAQAAALREAEPMINAASLWDSTVSDATFERYEGSGKLQYLQLTTLVADRYPTGEDRELEPALIGVRTMNWDALDTNVRTWTNKHLKYTHSYGVGFAPTNAAKTNGEPAFQFGEIPLRNIVTEQTTGGTSVNPTNPEFRVYFSENQQEFVVANSSISEVDYSKDNALEASATDTYTGGGGVQLDFWRRAAYALRFGDRNLLLSTNIDDNSEIITDRDIRTRVEKVAPFLQWDAEAVPVVTSTGITWVLDGYTTSRFYPYSQRIGSNEWNQLGDRSDLKSDYNYIRNSVKATVDAYTGEVTLYIVDTTDPIIKAYQKAFPAIFVGSDQIPQDLREHVRYPADLFAIQTSLYGKYRLTEPQQFASGNEFLWDVVQQSGSGTPNNDRTQSSSTNQVTGEVTRGEIKKQEPQYQLIQLPGEDTPAYRATRLFGPPQRGDATGAARSATLTAMMTAESTFGPNYGKLTVLEFDSDAGLLDVFNVGGRMQADERISSYVTPISLQGSQVQYSEVNVLPVANSLVYWRSLAVVGRGSVPLLSQVIVQANNNIRMEPTLQAALARAVADPPDTKDDPGRPIVSLGGVTSTPTTTTPSNTTTTTTTTVPGETTTTVSGATTTTLPTSQLTDAQKVEAAKRALDEAQRQLDEARRLLD
jgi:uncharacterized membrane protein (UPF0182 family)